MASYNEGRLSRWSRLKRTRARGEEVREPEAETAVAEATDVSVVGEGGDAAVVKRTARPQAGIATWVDGKPFMSPLAAPEEDTSLRGIAATPLIPAAPEPEEPRVYEDDERELTEEEQEVVDALPPIEDLNPQSDFTAFMNKKVPEFIRRKALRKLWLSDPSFSFLDGMNEYDEDYSILTALAEGATAYKPGEGYFGKPQVEKPEEMDEEGDGVTAEKAPEDAVKKPESTRNVRAPETKNAAYARPGAEADRFRDEAGMAPVDDDDDVGDGEDDDV